jgi:hypothetical protein
VVAALPITLYRSSRCCPTSWERLVTTHRVIGSQVYDARLVAAMMAHGVGRILTFNAGDFASYGIEVIHPSAVS